METATPSDCFSLNHTVDLWLNLSKTCCNIYTIEEEDENVRTFLLICDGGYHESSPDIIGQRPTIRTFFITQTIYHSYKKGLFINQEGICNCKINIK